MRLPESWRSFAFLIFIVERENMASMIGKMSVMGHGCIGANNKPKASLATLSTAARNSGNVRKQNAVSISGNGICLDSNKSIGCVSRKCENRARASRYGIARSSANGNFVESEPKLMWEALREATDEVRKHNNNI